MVETRKTMLKIHDNDKARRVTKNDTIETESIVMSGLFWILLIVLQETLIRKVLMMD